MNEIEDCFDDQMREDLIAEIERLRGDVAAMKQGRACSDYVSALEHRTVTGHLSEALESVMNSHGTAYTDACERARAVLKGLR